MAAEVLPDSCCTNVLSATCQSGIGARPTCGDNKQRSREFRGLGAGRFNESIRISFIATFSQPASASALDALVVGQHFLYGEIERACHSYFLLKEWVPSLFDRDSCVRPVTGAHERIAVEPQIGGGSGLTCAHCGFEAGNASAFYCPKCGMRMVRGQ